MVTINNNNRKAYFFIIIIFFSLLLSCKQITNYEVKRAYDKSQFNPELIENINNYSKLKDFLIQNLDTIISYRKSVHIEQFDDECNGFTIARGPYDIKHVPEFIYPRLDSLIKLFQNNKLNYFTICKNGNIEFNFETSYPYGNNIYVVQRLLWNKRDNCKSIYAYSKDSVLSNKWIYDICVDSDTE